MDVILDNSGLELYTDLLLADFLITSNQAASVTLHGKLLPWFVSDVMSHDLEEVLRALESDRPPAGMQGVGGEGAWGPVRRLAQRWRGHLTAGRWVYKDHAFWTTPFPFWWMEQVTESWYSWRLCVVEGGEEVKLLTIDEV